MRMKGKDMAKKKLTFEQAMEKLEAIVEEIEEGKVSLEESVERYAEGIKLIQQCRGILEQAEQKIQVLAKGSEGELEAAGELDDSQDEPIDED